MLSDDSTPLVLIRVDDDRPTDRDFERRLMARGLYAELAIPTALVGKDRRPGWAELRDLATQGFVPVAHSRVHGAAPAADQQFIGEVIGSLSDLAAHNMPTTIFVQPGTWQDSLNFDTPATIENWRGSLFQTFTANVEAYVYPVPRLCPLGNSVRLGLSHYTVSNGASPRSILYAWTLATQPWHCTVFMVHTLSLPSPGTLDWFLDSLAVAKATGRIRLAHSVSEFFGPQP
jgi:hypothetical protein